MTTAQPSKGLSISLWIAQVILAALFGMTGSTKLLQPISELAATLPWAATMPEGMVRFIGLSELLGAIGILLPSMLRRLPMLSVAAAGGLVIVQLLAAIFHATRGEFPMIGMNVILAAIAAFVAWGRATRARIQAR
ncbi:MAG: DoxX family protein [Bacteroidetes bacterium]|nr:DoxX family protein [Bacteroidota bacterium]